MTYTNIFKDNLLTGGVDNYMTPPITYGIPPPPIKVPPPPPYPPLYLTL
jgi:hypothetical protein